MNAPGSLSDKDTEMLDIVVSGGLAVLPSGPQPADIGVAGGRIAAIGAPGSLAAIGAGRIVDAAGQIVIPGGIDPHVHCRWPIVVPGVTPAPADRRAGAGQPRGAARRDDDDHRFRAGRGGRPGAERDRAPAEGMGRRLPLRLRLSHDGPGQDRARDPAAAQGSSRGGPPFSQDLHDRHHALAARAAWSISATSGRY